LLEKVKRSAIENELFKSDVPTFEDLLWHLEKHFRTITECTYTSCLIHTPS
jgi:hypothetical protein